METSERELKHRVSQLEQLASLDVPTIADNGSVPGWVIEHSKLLWDYGFRGSFGSMLVCYGLMSRKPDLKGLTYLEKFSLDVTDENDGWSAYLARLGSKRIQVLYANRGHYSSDGFKAWEELRDYFRQLWLMGIWEDDIFVLFDRDQMAVSCPQAAKYHQEKLKARR